MEIESFHVITADFTSLLAASPNPTSGELQASQTCWNDSRTILEAGRFAACGLVLPALPQVPASRAGSAQPGAQGLLRAGGAAPSQRGGLAGAGSAGAVHRLPARAVGLPQT